MITHAKELLLHNRDPKQIVVKNVFWLTITQGSRVLRLVTIIYAARILGAAQYGTFSYLLGLLGLLAFFPNLGIEELLTRDIAKHADKRSEYFTTGFWLGMFFLFLASVLTIVAAPSLVTIASVRHLIPLAVLLMIFDHAGMLVLSYVRGIQKMQWEALIVIMGNLTMALAGFFILFQQPSDKNLLLAYILGSAVAFFTSIIVGKKIVRKIFRDFRQAIALEMLHNCWPLAVSGAFGLMFGLDIFMLGWWRTTTEIGFYAAGQRIVQILYILPMTLTTAMLPALAAIAKNNDRQKEKTAIEKSMAAIFMITLPIIVGGIILSQPIMEFIYGDPYLPGVMAFQILLFNLLPIAPGMLISNLVLAHNQQKKIVKYAVVASLSNIFLNVLWIPRWGISGAAFATLIAQTILVGFTWWQIKKISDFDAIPHLKNICISSMAMGVPCFFLKTIGLPIVANILISISIYFSLLWIMKEKTVRDFFALLRSSPAKDVSGMSITPID